MNIDEKYELCYKFYKVSCKMINEKPVSFEAYSHVVPLSQIEEMIKYGYVGSAKIEY